MVANFNLPILIILLCVSILIADEKIPLIQPSQLMIGTVIDTSNAEIVRDALNMIKTLRIFGKSMNAANIVVGITDTTEDSNLNLLSELAVLGVDIVFIPQSPPGQAKTLNKFRMFEAFDSIKYNYFLWLDADIVIFDDPMPYLHMHKYPGSIECVPDFYSYMRRYPSVNTSSEYWNNELPSFYLLGEYETAPHGICNTGVLFFDSLSLSKFTTGLQTILENATYMSEHGTDRFVDSLIFTKIVNSVGIDVTILPHSLNYMALFEREIQEEIVEPSIVLAHMLSDTELYCTTSTSIEGDLHVQDSQETSQSDACSCVYRNKLLPLNGSLLRDTIQEKILSSPDICLTLAGQRLPTEWETKKPAPTPATPAKSHFQSSGYSAQSIQTAAGSSAGTLGHCRLLEPALHGYVLHSPSRSDSMELNIQVMCSGLVTSDSLLVHNTVAEYMENRSDGAEIIVHSSQISVETIENENNAHFSYILSFAPTSNSFNSASAEYSVHIEIKSEHHNQLPTAATLPLSFHTTTVHAMFTVVYDDLIPPGQVHYSQNPLLASKPIALASQLEVPKYLNTRNMRGTGVVSCCTTHKGVQTVYEIIEHWRGEFILIIIENTPALTEKSLQLGEENSVSDISTSLQDMAARIRKYCRDRTERSERKLTCHISTPPAEASMLESVYPPGVSHARFLGHSLRSSSVSFVYLDVLPSFTEQSASLEVWWKSLTKSGLLMGSGYAPPTPQRPWASTAGYAPEGSSSSPEVNTDIAVAVSHLGKQWIAASGLSTPMQRVQAMLRAGQHAIDAQTARLGQSVLLTYRERDPVYCEPFASRHSTYSDNSSVSNTMRERAMWAAWECAPAWYLHKYR